MGIKGLYDKLKNAWQTVDLGTSPDFFKQAFDLPVVVGIDASGWLHASISTMGLLKSSSSKKKKRAAWKKRASNYFITGLRRVDEHIGQPIVVFDGDGLPAVCFFIHADSESF